MIREIVVFVSTTIGLSAAYAQQPCNPGQAGTAGCPLDTAPAATAVPDPSTDGSTRVQQKKVTPLFNSVTPPNGFMIRPDMNIACWVNDNGPAANRAGFLISGNANFATPPGYRPMGPVSVFCTATGIIGESGAAVAARSW
jgi:hypothetical protein